MLCMCSVLLCVVRVVANLVICIFSSVVASLAAGSCADYQNQQQGPWLSIKYKGAVSKLQY